jgi:hypothetical protein
MTSQFTSASIVVSLKHNSTAPCSVIASISGIDNPDFSLYPDKDTQLKWLAVYLKAKTISAVEEEDVHRLFVVVNKFALVS